MDKVKIVLAVIKKYHFWLLCLAIVVLGAAVWSSASADLAKQYDAQKRKLDGALQSARSIAGEAGHPNEKTNRLLAELNGKQRQKVLKSWRSLYEKQQKQNPWPAILGPQFLEHVKSRKPNEEIKRQYRALYQTFIRDYIPKLFEVVDYRHAEEIEVEAESPAAAPSRRSPALQRGAMGMGGAKEQQNFRIVGIVDWDAGDRQRILESFWWRGAPTTIQLRMAQEDLWVYKALLEIIKATNEGATSHYNAAIKKIIALEIAQAAASALSSGGPDLMSVVSGAKSSRRGGGMGGDMGMGGMGGMGGDMGMDGMGDGMGGTGLAEEDKAVLEDRYVDQNRKPLSATSASPFAEFKMMPIRMCLQMDQRKIPKLLVECANSTMPVEVQRIRINPSETLAASSGGGGRGMGGSGMGGGGRGMGGGGMGMGRPAVATLTAARGGKSDEVNLQEVPVEIVGIIYIYNPPDLAKVGTGTAAEADQALLDAADASDVAPGASVPSEEEKQ